MELKKYKPSDELEILELFSLAFGKNMTKEFWEWRYLNNPTLKEPLINLMWDMDKLVGHYAVSPVILNIKEEKVLTSLSMTTMTHPDYGGKGIFTDLAENLYHDIYKNNGIQAVWGFPNLNSHYGLIKRLKWNDVSLVHSLRLFSEVFNKYDKVNYRTAYDFSAQHAAKIKENNKGEISVHKDANYLNWRYRDHPDNEYHIIELADADHLEFVVIKIIDSFDSAGTKEVDILEHGYDANPEVINEVISAVLSFLSDKGETIISLNTWMPIFDPRHKLLERNKFRPEKPLTFMGYRAFSEKCEVLKYFNSWDLTMGDSDVF
ncbi:GNAT family N-acetyltransferase [Marivirga arenosa]|uniref:GNAT family N-acetyltransferase n=1 Tax=Marivirga arenosa TaxID=3059076 RepID=A0AA51RD92_9BACT|nr:GNAT family N-acetyltransferase [Marivirga sp. ABR2-2]WMN06815.1 GNAT family N-acetyltransferase [Marivirga sp. ABR2-2]